MSNTRLPLAALVTLVLSLLLVVAPSATAKFAEKTPEELTNGVLADFIKYGTVRDPNPQGENIDERSERYAQIAESIVKACRNHPWPGWPLEGCVALSSTAAKWESGLLRSVHEGGLKGPAGELCLFQLHRLIVRVPDESWRVTREEWLKTTGLDREATDMCADAGVRSLGWQVKRCSIKYEGGGWYQAGRVFQAYHLPNSGCPIMISEMSGKRGRSYQSLLWKIQR